jgi:hypothetical protein
MTMTGKPVAILPMQLQVVGGTCQPARRIALFRLAVLSDVSEPGRRDQTR